MRPLRGALPSDECPHPRGSRGSHNDTDKQDKKGDPFKIPALVVTDTDNNAACNKYYEQHGGNDIHSDVCHALDFRLYLRLEYVFKCAAYAHHAMRLGYWDEDVGAWFSKGLCALNRDHTVEKWLALLMEFGRVN